MDEYECPVRDEVLEREGFTVDGEIKFRKVAGHRLTLAEVKAPPPEYEEAALPAELPFETDTGEVIMHEAQKVIFIAPHEVNPEMCWVFTCSPRTKKENLVYVHLSPRRAMDELWTENKIRQRERKNVWIVGIAPVFRPGDLVEMTKKINKDCQECGAWAEYTLDTVQDDHPLCGRCAHARDRRRTQDGAGGV